MCQITVDNLGDDFLNRELFLLLGTEGSAIHADGWGYADSSGEITKSYWPMYLTNDTGSYLAKGVCKTSAPLLGHIRQASSKVPVCTENAHPFKLDDMVFVHNGKLTPKKSEDFDIDYSLTEINATTNKEVTVWYKRSDSLIFFEEFVKDYKELAPDFPDEEKLFVEAVTTTMAKFDGKFAMVFIIKGKYYIVRGKTADLHISYRLSSGRKDATQIGWAINTERKNLLSSTLLLSNLHQLRGEKPIHFSEPLLIAEESIYVAEATTLRKIGEIKETTFVTTSGAAYATNFTAGNGTTQSTTIIGSNLAPEGLVAKYAKEIFDFLSTYSLSLTDFQNILLESWDVSITEMTEETTKFTVKKILERLKSETTRQIHKSLKEALKGYPLYLYRYGRDIDNYPWMLNPKNQQLQLVRRVREEKS
jgi:predicted glutamine amidotransferase